MESVQDNNKIIESQYHDSTGSVSEAHHLPKTKNAVHNNRTIHDYFSPSKREWNKGKIKNSS